MTASARKITLENFFSYVEDFVRFLDGIVIITPFLVLHAISNEYKYTTSQYQRAMFNVINYSCQKMQMLQFTLIYRIYFSQLSNLETLQPSL